MRKGVIVSKKEKTAVVVTEDGRFYDIPINGDISIGEQIGVSSKRKMVCLFSMFLFLSFNLIGWGMYGFVRYNRMPMTYVALDINPGVEFVLNKDDEVLYARGCNEQGKVILAGKNFRGAQVDTAVADIVATAVQTGYLTFDSLGDSTDGKTQTIPNAVMITVANDDENRTQELKSNLTDSVDGYFNKTGIFGLILTMNFSYQSWLNYQTYGIDMGKMQLVKLAETCGVPFEEAKDYSVKKLNQIICEQYGDTQAQLDESAILEQERRINLCKENVQSHIQQFDREKFLQDKQIYLKNSEILQYKMCEQWEEYKNEWRKQIAEQEIAA